MISKSIDIRGYLKEYNADYKRLTLQFLDSTIEPFTYEYLMKYYALTQTNPIKGNEFYVKFDIKKSLCFLDKNMMVRVPVQDLVGHVVKMTVSIKHYNFMDPKTSKKNSGWNINLLCGVIS